VTSVQVDVIILFLLIDIHNVYVGHNVYCSVRAGNGLGIGKLPSPTAVSHYPMHKTMREGSHGRQTFCVKLVPDDIKWRSELHAA